MLNSLHPDFLGVDQGPNFLQRLSAQMQSKFYESFELSNIRQLHLFFLLLLNIDLSIGIGSFLVGIDGLTLVTVWSELSYFLCSWQMIWWDVVYIASLPLLIRYVGSLLFMCTTFSSLWLVRIVDIGGQDQNLDSWMEPVIRTNSHASSHPVFFAINYKH